MGKVKTLFKNWRILLVVVCVILALFAINPSFSAEGVSIRHVTVNSSAALGGIESPKGGTTPMSKERVLSLNNQPILSVADYYAFTSTLQPNRTVHVKTTKGIYQFVTKEAFEIIQLNETISRVITVEVFDNLTNTTINETRVIIENKTKKISLGTEDLGLTVSETPKSNLRKGLDLEGGTRVLLQPQEILSDDQLESLIENMKTRLNIFGLSDIVVREAGDLSGNQYVLVEIAGAKESEVNDLLAKQGKFEATIGDVTVFSGGEDITYVCKTAECSGIDPQFGCQQSAGAWSCRFSFSISLSPEAARKQADATAGLSLSEDGTYLSEPLVLFLDDVKVDELQIASDLQGRPVSDISISGSGEGISEEQAITNTLDNMKRLQTIMVTGSLPVKLDIVKTDIISPALGKGFLKNTLFIGLFSLLGVAVVVFIRYRRLKVVIPMAITIVVEVILLLGVASVIGWNLDLAAIAGIIIAVGTGIDHQIVITDETLRGKLSEIYDWKKRIKSAFYIITAAYLTTVIAMLPLWFAGAGLLKGFALTTIIGVSIGVFISRPAYAATIEILLKK